MDGWEKTYKDNKFYIDKKEPSFVLKKMLEFDLSGGVALDAGCGQGRNSIFLSKEGFSVDAFDVADVAGFDGLHEKISFIKSDVSGFNYRDEKYDLVVAARLIQYLSPEVLNNFLNNIYKSLKYGGLFGLSFNTSGGIFDKSSIDVEKYSHEIDVLKKVFETTGFSMIYLGDGSSVSDGVPYDSKIKTYDIILKK